MSNCDVQGTHHGYKALQVPNIRLMFVNLSNQNLFFIIIIGIVTVATNNITVAKTNISNHHLNFSY